VHVRVQRREARPAPARQPEALDGPSRRVLRSLSEGRAAAGVDGEGRSVSRERQARRDAALQENDGGWQVAATSARQPETAGGAYAAASTNNTSRWARSSGSGRGQRRRDRVA